MPWAFWASQLSLRSELSAPWRLRELLAQGPSEPEVTLREALLLFPSSSPSPSRQCREGAGQAREEQLQSRAWASQEQEGPSSLGGSEEPGEGSADATSSRPQACPPSPPALTVHREAQGEVLGAQGAAGMAGEFSSMLCLHPGQLQDPRVGKPLRAQGLRPPGPAQPGWGVAVGDTDQAQALALQDWEGRAIPDDFRD